MSLNGDGDLVTGVGTWTGVGLSAEEIAVSGLRCDLVRRYAPSVVLFLTRCDRGLGMVVKYPYGLAWVSGSRFGPAFWL